MERNRYTPTIPAQIGYMVRWFAEWSEMQRSDFLPILVQNFGNKGYMNGLVAGMENLKHEEGKHLSLFQCRIKLFHEWSENWDVNEKDQLLSLIKSIDPDFIEKYEEEVKKEAEIKNCDYDTTNGFDTSSGAEVEPV